MGKRRAELWERTTFQLQEHRHRTQRQLNSSSQTLFTSSNNLSSLRSLLLILTETQLAFKRDIVIVVKVRYQAKYLNIYKIKATSNLPTRLHPGNDSLLHFLPNLRMDHVSPEHGG